MNKLKNLIVLSIALFFVSVNIDAQNVNWGKLQKADNKWYYPNILEENDEAIFVFSRVKNDYFVEKFNKSDKSKVYGQKVELPEIKRTIPSFERIDFIGDKFIVFVSLYHKKDKISELYAYTIDAESGKVNNNKTKLFEISVEKKWRRGAFSVIPSMDKSKLLINHYAYYKQNGEYKDKFVLLDSKLDILLEREDVISKDKANFSSYNWIIDNDGSIFYIKSYNEYDQFIVTYDATKDYEKWEERIDLSEFGPDTKITRVNASINAENDMIVSGYYNKKRDFSGCFFMKIENFSKEIVVNKINEFSDDFRKDFLSERQLKKGKEKKISDKYNIIEIINKNDGGIIHIGESYTHQYYYDQHGNLAGESTYNEDIVILNISPEGDLIWAKRLPKRQKFYVTYGAIMSWGSFGVKFFTINFDIDEYFSYVSAIDENKLYIMFNDNPKNSQLESVNSKRSPMKKINRSVVMAHSYDLTTGEENKKIYHSIHDFSVYLKPTTQFQKDQNSNVIIFGKKKKDFKFGEIQISK